MLRAFLAFIFVFAIPIVAYGQQPSVLDVLSIYRDLNDMCRGRSGDDPHAAKACNVREKVSSLLNSMGYCYGSQGQDAADMQWHKCTAHELF